MFQWSDEEKSSGYASSSIISSVQTRFVSANMADRCGSPSSHEGSGQATRTQQEAPDNIQYLLEQLLTNQNPNGES